ncbi:MAG: hypothetical protein WDM92_10455 [Caulobacteraceae bacterium]
MLALAFAAPAQAHTKSETHSTWRVVGNVVHVRSVPEVEAKRLSTPDGAPPTDERMGRYLATHVSVLVKDKPCPMTEPVRATAASPGFRRYEFGFACPTAVGMKLHSDAFFDLVPSHVTFAQVIPENGDFVEQLIDKDHRTLDATGEGRRAAAERQLLPVRSHGDDAHLHGHRPQSFILGFIIPGPGGCATCCS